MRHEAIVICGNAGVGKTTYARTLAASLPGLLLDIDTVSEHLVQAGLTGMGLDRDDRDSPHYKRLYRDAIHETLFRIAVENLDNLPCVIVAPFTQERRDPLFPQLLQERLGAPFRIIYVTCSDALRAERIRARGNPRDAAKLENWTDYAKKGIDSQPLPFPHTVINTDQVT